MTSNQRRQPAGVPAGGQYATDRRAETPTDLSTPITPDVVAAVHAMEARELCRTILASLEDGADHPEAIARIEMSRDESGFWCEAVAAGGHKMGVSAWSPAGFERTGGQTPLEFASTTRDESHGVVHVLDAAAIRASRNEPEEVGYVDSPLDQDHQIAAMRQAMRDVEDRARCADVVNELRTDPDEGKNRRAAYAVMTWEPNSYFDGDDSGYFYVTARDAGGAHVEGLGTNVYGTLHAAVVPEEMRPDEETVRRLDVDPREQDNVLVVDIAKVETFDFGRDVEETKRSIARTLMGG